MTANQKRLNLKQTRPLIKKGWSSLCPLIAGGGVPLSQILKKCNFLPASSFRIMMLDKMTHSIFMIDGFKPFWDITVWLCWVHKGRHIFVLCRRSYINFFFVVQFGVTLYYSNKTENALRSVPPLSVGNKSHVA